jgi:hypothetical protein
MDNEKLASKKQVSIFSGFAMFGIGVIYTLEFLGIWYGIVFLAITKTSWWEFHSLKSAPKIPIY